ncbi:MAG: NTP transferase domain-containing protein, partial [Chloroflexota bacterium]
MLTSIVLAGGKGRRLGRDKATVLLGGESLLHRAINRLSPFGPVVVVVAAKQTLDLPPGAETVIDVYPG